MSYILDALKKSEAERSRGVVPNLLTPRQTPLRRGLIGWVVAAALLANAALVAAWLYWPSRTALPSRSSTADVPPPATVAATSQATTERSPAISTDPVAGAAVAEREKSTPPSRDVGAPSELSAGIGTPEAARTFGTTEPDDGTIASRYPFSTHVYASDPSMRAVTLHGRRYTEGDTIDHGVRIKEITETGVVLDVDGRSVSIDLLHGWH